MECYDRDKSGGKLEKLQNRGGKISWKCFRATFVLNAGMFLHQSINKYSSVMLARESFVRSSTESE